MDIDHPLRFQPLLRRALWGGRRLESMLGKALPAGNDYAESWEIVDRGQDQSVVASGPLAGATLGQLVGQHSHSVLGPGQQPVPFPLLFKFLDAHRNLSVQVHPNDWQAAQLDPPDRGKTEAWVVLYSEPDSLIYAGLKSGVDRHTFQAAIQHGTAEDCLHRFHPSVGDCLFLPAGTVHALGAGLVVAEIQQSSDVTYRLFDWNRVGPDGRGRPLHIQQGMRVIDFQRGPVDPCSAAGDCSEPVRPLVTCDKFVLERPQFETSRQIGGDDRCHLIVVLHGTLDIERDPAGQSLRIGQTVLLPAQAGSLRCSPAEPVELLDIYLPGASGDGASDDDLSSLD